MSAGGLTDVVLLNLVDVAVNWWVAKEGQHHRVAAGQLHHMGGVPFHGVRRRQRGLPQGPGTSGDVKDPQLIRHVGWRHLQFSTKHEDVILQERRQAVKLAIACWDYLPVNHFEREKKVLLEFVNEQNLSNKFKQIIRIFSTLFRRSAVSVW